MFFDAADPEAITSVCGKFFDLSTAAAAAAAAAASTFFTLQQQPQHKPDL